jgi:hypothetical protein
MAAAMRAQRPAADEGHAMSPPHHLLLLSSLLQHHDYAALLLLLHLLLDCYIAAALCFILCARCKDLHRLKPAAVCNATKARQYTQQQKLIVHQGNVL